MSDFIIIFRNPWNKRVGAITLDDGDDSDLAVFNSYKEAEEAAENTTMTKVAAYEIVELTI